MYCKKIPPPISSLISSTIAVSGYVKAYYNFRNLKLFEKNCFERCSFHIFMFMLAFQCGHGFPCTLTGSTFGSLCGSCPHKTKIQGIFCNIRYCCINKNPWSKFVPIVTLDLIRAIPLPSTHLVGTAKFLNQWMVIMHRKGDLKSEPVNKALLRITKYPYCTKIDYPKNNGFKRQYTSLHLNISIQHANF